MSKQGYLSDKMATTGPVAGDTVAAELELYAHDIKVVKNGNVNVESKSVKGDIDLRLD